ncbi:MAG: hypothetical protein F6J87_01860 [Spirulina sp. SIO3F2]|nr:hypothetical protein [Spirulina sp. SIO3F2]
MTPTLDLTGLTHSQIQYIQTLIETFRTNNGLQTQHWPASILNYHGDPDFPAFETYRNDLIPPQDPILF